MTSFKTVLEPKVKLEYTNCDLCGGANTIPFLEPRNPETNERFSIVRCSFCGLVYLNPRPAKDVIGRYYPLDSYYSYQDFSNKKFNYRDWLRKISLEGYYDSKNPLKKLLAWLLVRNFMIVVPQGKKGKLLDIGCGSGDFLHQMKQFGWEVYGVEISSEAAAIGNQRGLNIFCGELEAADYPGNYFDVVVLSQTLEHVYSPGFYLERSYWLLKEGGLLIIGVPNLGCLESQIFGNSWHALDVPRHLYFFTIASLRGYLEKYGFTVKKVLSKKFSLPIKGMKSDLAAFIQNEHEDESSLRKIWLSFLIICLLFFKKGLRFLLSKGKAKELGVYIAFYARKPSQS